MPLLALPVSVRLALVCLVGLGLGGLVNWAIYRLAWNRREITPWGPAPAGALPRAWADCLPIVGWLRLRREHKVHGRGFWIRPLAIEVLLGTGLGALYWWEVVQQGLITPQVKEIVAGAVAVNPPVVSYGLVHAIFCAHAILIVFLAAASFIDIDEKLIPDEITVIGTLLGLTLMTLLPYALLPDVELREVAPVVVETIALPIAIDGAALYAEPTTLVSPNEWPERLNGWIGLVAGQACWWLWCFALAPRVWRGRRGVVTALSLIQRRVTRELTRGVLGGIAWIGALAIAVVWWFGTPAWLGLLSALVGMIVCGGMVWVVRLVGTAALGREAMGFGDVTLMMMVGTFIGWQASIIVFFVAPLPALVIGLLQWALHDDDVIPYGPSLSLGTLAVAVAWPTFWSPGLQNLFSVGWLMPAVVGGCFVLLGAMLTVWQRIKIALFGAGEVE